MTRWPVSIGLTPKPVLVLPPKHSMNRERRQESNDISELLIKEDFLEEEEPRE